VILTGTRKLAFTAALFAVAIATVAVAAVTRTYAPLFFTIIPLVLVAWVLSRDEPGEERDEDPDLAATGSAEAPTADTGTDPQV
jgi:hypothetical protein